MRFLVFFLSAAAASAAPLLDYNRDIRPILSENCFSCHGPDEKARKGKRRIDLAENAYADREGIIAIVPGKASESDAWIRIASDDDDERMPPLDSHRKLTEADKHKIETWINQGATYAAHWSFIPPRKSSVPASGNVGPIDAFIRERLKTEGMKPAPEADRATLLRRVTLDLTGLPPSAAEIESFLADRDSQAYEKRVDRLLRSQHFGERMALDWLDASRYADTNGFSIDGGRNLWLWRDWVIQAFNDNLPYDRFLLEQLAGDLLPSPTDSQIIATGFQRNNMVTHEGGTIPAENLTNYNADRVKTLGESVLGLTLGCAQCHDHKFDPITQKDYFQMFAFFNSLPDRGLDGNAGLNPRPRFEVHTVLKTDEAPRLREEIKQLKRALSRIHRPTLASWEKRERESLANRGKNLRLHPLKLLKISTPNRGAGYALEGENRFRVTEKPGLAAFDLSAELPKIDQPITGLRMIAYPVENLPGGGRGYGPTVPQPQPLSDENAPPVKGPPDLPPPIGTFVLSAISISADSVPGDQVDLHGLRAIDRVTASSWELENPPLGCLDPRNENGWAPDAYTKGPAHLTVTFTEPLRSEATPYITVQLNFGRGRDTVPGLVELQVLTGTDDGTDLPASIEELLAIPSAKRSALTAKTLWNYCVEHSPELAAQRTTLANLEERLKILTDKQPTMVMAVAEKPRDTFILNRGDYSQPTVKVTAGTLSALPAMPTDFPANRLGLAKWIVMKNHPLTARVAVNRIWRQFFGLGIVATPADFGSQGQWPSHPELLDWLAVDFVERGWDVKAFVREIVLSQTYRQSSVTTSEMIERDPQNRLLARGPRFRLPAEFIRDSALQISGLLAPRIGGPSVNPYTPGDLWREVSHYGSTPATAQTFVQDHGEKLYRRSLYTYWKRTAPPPNMTAFDAPNREVCTIDRASTTTPLQALVMLNDIQFVETARAFAERILGRPGNDTTRLRWAFEEATARLPEQAELAVLDTALSRERARYVGDPSAAARYLAIGESPRNSKLPLAEHAAWAQITATLLNLSEVVTRN